MDKVGTREERIRGRWTGFEGRNLPRKSGKAGANLKNDYKHVVGDFELFVVVLSCFVDGFGVVL